VVDLLEGVIDGYLSGPQLGNVPPHAVQLCCKGGREGGREAGRRYQAAVASKCGVRATLVCRTPPWLCGGAALGSLPRPSGRCFRLGGGREGRREGRRDGGRDGGRERGT